MATRLKTMAELHEALEERRIRTIGLLRTLDRLGMASYVLGRAPTVAYAEADAQCMAALGRLRDLPGDVLLHATDARRYEELLDVNERVELDVLDLLPRAAQKAVAEKRPVGELTVDEEDLYPPEPRRSPRPSRGRR